MTFLKTNAFAFMTWGDRKLNEDKREIEGLDKKRIVTALICVFVVVAIIHFSTSENREWKFWSRSGEDFIQGRKRVTLGQYRQAIPLLQKYLNKHPQGRYASRAIFFIGKAFVGLEEMDLARTAFNDIQKRFPDSLEAHKARYKIALIDLLDGQVDLAIQQFSILAHNPDGPLAPEASAMVSYLTLQSGLILKKESKQF
jgi:TolA-binding protein